MYNCSIGDGDYDIVISNSTEEFLNLELMIDSNYFNSTSDRKLVYSSDLRRLRKEIKRLEMECDDILPQITDAENDLKKLENDKKHQEKTLKLILNHCEEELNKVVQIRDNSKQALRELDLKLIEMDLTQEINDTIAKHNIKKITNISKMMIDRLLKIETVMNSLLEKAEKLRGAVLDGETDDKTLYQIRTLNMNLKKCDQEYQRANEANEEIKKKVTDLNYRILNLELHYELNERIHKSALQNMNRELMRVRSKLLKLGGKMIALWENTRKLAEYMMPKEITKSKSVPDLKWIFRPITAVHNSLSAQFSSLKNDSELPADISLDGAI